MSNAPAVLQQAHRYFAAGHAAEGVAALRGLIAQEGGDPGVAAAAGGMLLAFGQPGAALAAMEPAVRAGGQDPALLFPWGAALATTGRAGEAIAPLRRVVELTPQNADAHALLAQSIVQTGAVFEGLSACRRGLELCPGAPGLSVLCYNILWSLGDDDCWRSLVPVVRAFPDRPGLCSALAVSSSYSGSATAQEIFEYHAAYGLALERQRPGPGLTAVHDPDPERALRVGIVAYDFQSDFSVGFFLRPLFEHLDRARFALVGLHTGTVFDAGTEWFRARCVEWRTIPPANPDALARQVLADRLDVVIEINAHAGADKNGARGLPAFQPRVAPVQVSYIGYSNTTGMRGFDYRIVDSLTDPAPAADALATERLWRLDPCFLCYQPNADAPACAAAPPSASKGRITFGVLCQYLYKFNPGLFRVWARILESVPGSRLLLKTRANENPGMLAHLRARMTGAGIDLSRLDMLARTRTYAEHLATYDAVDIALDTFPYNGTTTVCEALLMGVPLITCVQPPGQDRHASRVALSLLGAAGASDLVAADADAFVAMAVALASDAPRLAEYRRTLRSRMLGSALCDGPAFGRRLGGALREMWRRRCAEARPGP